MIQAALALLAIATIQSGPQPAASNDPYVLPRAMFYDYKHDGVAIDSWLTIPARAATRKGPTETNFLFHYVAPQQAWPPLNAPSSVNVIYYKVPSNGAEPDKVIDSVTGYTGEDGKFRRIPLNVKTLEKVRIVAYGKAPPASGIFHTRRRIAIMAGTAPLDIYVTWLGEGQDMPGIGAVCDIKWYWDWIDGWGHPDDGNEVRPDRVMEDFSCRP